MKNLLRSALYLSIFAIAGILFQISCSSDSMESSISSVPIEKIVFAKRTSASEWQIWACNYDGTNLTQVPFTLPANVIFSNSNLNAIAKLSPDGQKVFFLAYDNNTNNYSIYSCNVDGSNTHEVIPVADATNIVLGGAY